MDARLPRSESPPAPIRTYSAAWRGLDARWRLAISIVAAIAVALIAWRVFAPHAVAPHTQPPAPVKVATAVMQNVTIQEHTIGTIVADSTVQITSRVEGQIASAHFREGDIVHRGDLLFELDPRPFQAALAQALATQKKDQAQLVSAQNDAARYSALAAQGAASKSQSDQFVAQAKALAATVAADEANVESARLNLAYSKIASPVDGKTGPILIQPGNVVPANGTNPLVVIQQLQPVKVSFFLPQADLPRIQDQMRARTLLATLQVHDAANTHLTAPVDFIGNAVDNTTGTVELRATFKNDDYRLLPGQLLDVSVSLANLRNAVVVPTEAVNQGPQGRYVYVVTLQNQAKMQPVHLLYDNGRIAAVSGAVRPGERVITDGQLRVVPGKPVSIVNGRASAGHLAGRHSVGR